jgi:hypothetical protein
MPQTVQSIYITNLIIAKIPPIRQIPDGNLQASINHKERTAGTISEICTNSGKKIHPEYSGKKTPTKRIIHSGTSVLKWPPQPPPTPRMCWCIWPKHLRLLCKPASWSLKNEIGEWTVHHSIHRNWYGMIKIISRNRNKLDRKDETLFYSTI